MFSNVFFTQSNLSFISSTFIPRFWGCIAQNLGCKIPCSGDEPDSKKIEFIMYIEIPNTTNVVQALIVTVQYYI